MKVHNLSRDIEKMHSEEMQDYFQYSVTHNQLRVLGLAF